MQTLNVREAQESTLRQGAFAPLQDQSGSGARGAWKETSQRGGEAGGSERKLGRGTFELQCSHHTIDPSKVYKSDGTVTG